MTPSRTRNAGQHKTNRRFPVFAAVLVPAISIILLLAYSWLDSVQRSELTAAYCGKFEREYCYSYRASNGNWPQNLPPELEIGIEKRPVRAASLDLELRVDQSNATYFSGWLVQKGKIERRFELTWPN